MKKFLTFLIGTFLIVQVASAQLSWVNPATGVPNVAVNEGTTQLLNSVDLNQYITGAQGQLSWTGVLVGSPANPMLISWNAGSPQHVITVAAPDLVWFGTQQILFTVTDGVHTLNWTANYTVNFINQSPTFTIVGGNTVSFNEYDVPGTYTINLSNITVGTIYEAAIPQHIKAITATSSDATIIPNPVVNYTYGNTPDKTTATIVLSPVQYAYGPVDITISVQDDSGDGVTDTYTQHVSITVIAVPPVVTITGPQPNNYTNQSPFNLTLSFDKPVNGLTAAGLTLTNCTVNSVTPAAGVTTMTYTVSITPAAAISTNTITVNANAALDNPTAAYHTGNAAKSISIIYDNTIPQFTTGPVFFDGLTSISLANQSAVKIYFTPNKTGTYTYSISDGVKNITFATNVSMTAATLQTITQDISGSGFADDATLTATITLTDLATNTNSGTCTVWKDALKPTAKNIIFPATINIYNQSSATLNFDNDDQGTYTYKITDGTHTVTGTVTILPALPFAKVSGTQTVNGIDVSTLSDGNLTVSVSAIDEVGNTSATPDNSITVWKDATVPTSSTASLTSGGTTVLNKANSSATVFKVTLNKPAAMNYTISSNNGGSVTGTIAIGSTVTGANTFPFDLSTAGGLGLADGTITITINTLTDIDGNINVAPATSATATLDQQSPFFTAAPSIAPSVAAAPVNAINLTNRNSVNIIFTPNKSVTYSYVVKLDGVATGITGASAGSVTGAQTITRDLSSISSVPSNPNLITVDVYITDLSNNNCATYPTTSASIVIDTDKPVITSIAPNFGTNPVDLGANTAVNSYNYTNMGVTINGEYKAQYTYTLTFTDQNAHTITLTGNLSGATTSITGIDLTGLNDVTDQTIVPLPKNITLNVTITDEHGNSSTTSSTMMSKDIIPPTFTFDIPTQGTATAPSNITFYSVIQWDEPTYGLLAGDFQASGTYIAAQMSATPSTTNDYIDSLKTAQVGNPLNGILYTFVYHPYAAAPQNHIQVTFLANSGHDAAGNYNTSASAPIDRYYDGIPPTVTFVAVSPTPTNANPVVFKAQFSEQVNGFTGGVISFTGSTQVAGLTATIVVVGSDTLVQVTGMTQDGDIKISVNAKSFQDIGTNWNQIVTTSAIIHYDMTPPTVTSITKLSDPTNGAVVFTVNMSEAVQNYDNTKIQLNGSYNGGALTGVFNKISATQATVTVTGMTANSFGNITLTLLAGAFQDIAGNSYLGGATSTINFDNDGPVVSGVAPASGAGVGSETLISGFTKITATVDDATTGNHNPQTVTFQLFQNDGVTPIGPVVTLTSGNDLQTNDPVGFAALTIMGDGTLFQMKITGTDKLGNATIVPITNLKADLVAPTITSIVVTEENGAGYTNANTLNVTVTFSEAVTNFDPRISSTITLPALYNVAYTFVQVTPSIYQFQVLTNGVTTQNITLGFGLAAAYDIAGNPSVANSLTLVVDHVLPTVKSITPKVNPTNGTPTYICRFSEPVKNLDNTKISITADATINGALTAAFVIVGTDTTIQVSGVGANSFGNIKVTINANAFADLADNNYAGGANATLNFDNIPPVITADPTNPDIVGGNTPINASATDNATGNHGVTTFTIQIVGFGSTPYLAGMTYSQLPGWAGIANGTVIALQFSATDGVGNTSTANYPNNTVDKVPPTIDVAGGGGGITFTQGTLTNATKINGTIKFSEAVSGLHASDIIISPNTISATNLLQTAPDTYTFDVNTINGVDVTYTFSINAGVISISGGVVTIVSGVVDIADNSNLASAGTYQIEVDRLNPSVTSIAAPAECSTTVRKGLSPMNVVVTFNEAVSTLLAANVSVTNATINSILPVAGPSATYTVNITPVAEGTVTLDVAAGVVTDKATNANTYNAAAKFSIYVDNTAPNIGTGISNPTAGQHVSGNTLISYAVPTDVTTPVTVMGTLTYNAVTSAAITVTSGVTKIGDFDLNGIGVPSTGDNNVTINLTAYDGICGNIAQANSTAYPPVTVDLDRQKPSIVSVTMISPAPNGLAVNQTLVKFSVVFSENIDATSYPLTPFLPVTASSGTITKFASTGANTAEVDVNNSYPGTTGNLTITFADGAVKDVVGNTNNAYTSASFAIDHQPPTLNSITVLNCTTGSPAGPGYINVSPLMFKFNFSEGITTFDITKVNITSTGLTLGTATYTDGTGVTQLSGSTSYIVSVPVLAGIQSGSVTVDMNGSTVADNTNPSPSITANYLTGGATPNQTINFNNTTFTSVISAPATVHNGKVHGLFTATITFSKSVTGFALGNITPTNATIGNLQGSGSVYTVDVTPNGANNTHVTLNIAAGQFTDVYGNSNMVSNTLDVIYDNIPPTVAVTYSLNKAFYIQGQSFTITATCSENMDMTAGSIPKFNLIGAGGTVNLTNVAYSGNTGATVYTYNYTIPAGANGLVTVTLTATDEAGNAIASYTGNTFTIDNTAPYVTGAITYGLVKTRYKNGDVIPITLTINPTISTTMDPGTTVKYAVTGSAGVFSQAATSMTTANNLTYTGLGANAIQVGLGDGTATISMAAGQDLAGNAITSAIADASATFIVDNTAPTPTIALAAGQSSSANTDAVSYTVDFGEPVTGFTAADLTLVFSNIPAGAVGITITPVGVAPQQVYTITITGLNSGANAGVYATSINLEVTPMAVVDLAGNLSNQQLVSPTIQYDNTPFHVVTVTPTPQYTNALNAIFLVQFNRPTTDFVVGDITPSFIPTVAGSFTIPVGLTVSDVHATDGTNTIYQVTITGYTQPSNGTIGFTIKGNLVHDVFSNTFNAYSVAAANYVNVDLAPPYAVIVATPTDPTNNNPIGIVIKFYDSATNLPEKVGTAAAPGYLNASSFITSPNCHIANIQPVNFPFQIFSADLIPNTGVTEGDFTVYVQPGLVSDLAGNLIGVPSNIFKIHYDGVPPTITSFVKSTTIVPPQPLYDGVAPYVYDVTFSENIKESTLSASSIVPSTGAGFAYNAPFVFNPAAPQFTVNWVDQMHCQVIVNSVDHDGIIRLVLPVGTFTDLAANFNAMPFTSDDIIRDATPPTPVIAVTGKNPTNADPTFTVNFGEVVTGFSAAGVAVEIPSGTPVVTGGVYNIQTADNITYTFAIAGLPALSEQTWNVYIMAGAAQDLATNLSNVSNTTTVYYDVTPPRLTYACAEPWTTNNSDFVVTLAFNEQVTGFDPYASLTRSPLTSITGYTVITPGQVFQLNIHAGGDGDITLQLNANSVQDLAGNWNVLGNMFKRVYDHTSPVISNYKPDGVPYKQVNGQALVSFNTTDLHPAAPTVVYVTINGDSVAATSGVTMLQNITNGAGKGWLSVPENGTFNLKFSVVDTTGNYASILITGLIKDDVPPQPVITLVNPAVANRNHVAVGTINVQIDFGEAVENFANTDVMVDNGGTVSFFQPHNGSAQLYDATITGYNEGAYTNITLAADAANDYAQNASLPASYSFFYDKTAPTVAVTSYLNGDPTNMRTIVNQGTVVTFTMAFSDADSIASPLFNPADIWASPVVNFTPNNASATPSAYTAAATFTIGGSWTASSDHKTFTYNWTVPAGNDGDVNVSVVAYDHAGNQVTANSFNINIDNTQPNVYLSDDHPDGIVKVYNAATGTAADVVTIYARFTDLHAIDESAGNAPTITISNTPGPGTVTNAAMTKIDNLNWKYVWTVASTNNFDSWGTVTINGKDIAGNSASAPQLDPNATTEPSLGKLQYWIDVVPPYCASIALMNGVTSPTNQSPVVVEVTFSEPIDLTTFDANRDIILSNAYLQSVNQVNNFTYDLTLVPFATIVTVDFAPGTVTDIAGNKSVNNPININNQHLMFVYKGVGPTPTIATTANVNNGFVKTSSFPVTITFNEAVPLFAIGNIHVDNGTLSNFMGPDPAQVVNHIYQYTVTWDLSSLGSVNGVPVTISTDATFQDIFSNFAHANSLKLTYDNVQPTVLSIISSAVNAAGYSNASLVPVTVKFSEPVTGFTFNSVVISNTSGTLNAYNFAGSGDTYTFNVKSDNATQGTYTVAIAGAVCTDMAGNSNVAATSYSYIFDNIPPQGTLSYLVNGAVPNDPSKIYVKDGKTLTITANFDSPMVNAPDLIFRQGLTTKTLTTVLTNPTTAVYTITINSAVDGWVDGTVVQTFANSTDLAGNVIVGTPTTNSSIVIDNTKPVLTIGLPDKSLTMGGPVHYTLNFDGNNYINHIADMTVVPVADVPAGSTATANTVSVAGMVLTVDGTLGDGNIRVLIPAGAIEDLAGNLSDAVYSEYFWVDHTSPNSSLASSVVLQGNFTNQRVIPFTVNFTEPVYGFTANKIVTSAGTVTNFSGGDGSASFTFVLDLQTIASTPGTAITVSIANNVCTDYAGNFANATSYAFTFDDRKPVCTSITYANPKTDIHGNVYYKNGDPITITAVFDEVLNAVPNVQVGFSAWTKGYQNMTLVSNDLINNTSTYTYTDVVNGWTEGNVVVLFAVGTDHANNVVTAVSNNTVGRFFNVDNTKPTFTVTGPNKDYTNTGAVRYTVTYTDDAANITLKPADVNVNAVGTTYTLNVINEPNYTNANGINYVKYLEFSGITGNGTIGINSINASTASDVAGNLADAYLIPTAIFNVDNIQPQPVFFSSVVNGNGRTNVNPVPVTITLNNPETVASLSSSSILVNGASFTGAISVINDNPITFMIYVPVVDGAYTISLPAGQFADLAGNLNIAAPAYSFIYDGIAPVPTITKLTPGNGLVSPIKFQVAFNEKVDPNDLTKVTTTAGTVGGWSADMGVGTNSLYNFVVNGPFTVPQIILNMAAGTFVDKAGNLSTAAAPMTFYFDSIPPVATMTSKDVDPVYFVTSMNTIQVALQFSEPVSGFNQKLLQLVNCIINGNGVMNSDSTLFTFNVLPIAPWPNANYYEIDVRLAQGSVTDHVGNKLKSEASLIFDYDVINPQPIITCLSTPNLLTNANPIAYKISFNEPMNIVGVPALVPTNGTYVNGSWMQTLTSATVNEYTFSIAPTIGQGTVSVQLPANKVFDIAGNANLVSNTYSISYDGVPPAVQISSTSVSNGGYTNNNTVHFQVNFTEAVNGFDQTKLTIAGANVANFNGNGTVYTFDLINAANVMVTVDINAGVCFDLAGNALANAAATYTYTFDNVAPQPGITTSLTNPTNATVIPFTVTLAEPVVGFTSDDIQFTNCVLSGNLTQVGNNYTFNVIPASSGLVSVAIPVNKFTDLAGNININAQASITYDGIAPIASLNGTQLTNAMLYQDTVRFTERVKGLVNTSIVITPSVNNSNNTLSQFVYVNDSTYAFAVNNIVSNFTISVANGATTDMAGNPCVGVTKNVTLDNVNPLPVIMLENGVTTPTNVSVIPFRVTFAEDVYGFTANAIYVNGSNTMTTQFTKIDARTYTFKINTAGSGQMDYAVNIPANSCFDVVNNGNDAAVTLNVMYDAVPPTAMVSSATVAMSGYTNASTASMTVTFSEKVNAFTIKSLVVTGATVANFVNVDGQNYTFNLTNLVNGPVSVKVPAGACQDLATNPNVASNVYTFTYDNIAPIAVLTTLAPTLNNLSSVTINFNFGEKVTSFDVNSITVTNAVKGTLTNPADGIYALTITPSVDGTVVVTVPANVCFDLAGNANVGGSLQYTYDSKRPTPTITATPVSNGALTNVSSISVDVMFDKLIPTTEFTIADVTLTNATVSGSLSAVTVPGTNTAQEYKFNITPNSAGAVAVFIADTKARDIAGNYNVASNTFSFTYDNVPPVPTIAMNNNPNPTNATVIPMMVAFSEAVIGFTVDDLVIDPALASVSAFTQINATTYYFNVSPVNTNATTDILVTVKGGSLQDLAGNLNVATAVYTVHYDGVQPVATISVIDGARNVANNGLSNSSAVTLQINFSKPVTGFVLSDIITNYGISSFVAASATNYTAQLTCNVGEMKTFVLSIPQAVAADIVGNQNVASASYTITLDRVAPMATIASTGVQSNGLTNLKTVPMTITFSKLINATTLSVNDFTITNGTIASLLPSADPNTFTFNVLPGIDGAVSLSINANSYTDMAGNYNTTSAMYAFTYSSDVTPPAASVTTTAPAYTNMSIPVTVSFTEPVTNLLPTSISVTESPVTVNYGISNWAIAADNRSVTFNVTPLDSGNVAITLIAGSFTDLVGNVNHQVNTINVIFDNRAPVVTKVSENAGNQLVNATISEPGIVFLVRSDVTYTTQTDLQNAVANSLASATPTATAGAVVVSTKGLGLGTYNLIGVDRAGNVSKVGGTVVIVKPTLSILNMPTPRIVCSNSAKITLTGSMSTGFFLASPGLTVNPNAPTAVFDPSVGAGTYLITYMFNNYSYSDTIKVISAPTADFRFAQAGFVVKFVNYSQNTTPNTSYHWDFGDGNGAYTENPLYKYDSIAKSHPYNVTLTLTDGTLIDPNHTCTIAPVTKVVWIVPTAINTIENKVSVNVYPSPNNGNFQLSYNAGAEFDVLSVKVMNVNGQVLHSEEFKVNGKTFTQNFDLSNLNTGIYMVEIVTKYGVQVKRIVINH